MESNTPAGSLRQQTSTSGQTSGGSGNFLGNPQSSSRHIGQAMAGNPVIAQSGQTSNRAQLSAAGNMASFQSLPPTEGSSGLQRGVRESNFLGVAGAVAASSSRSQVGGSTILSLSGPENSVRLQGASSTNYMTAAQSSDGPSAHANLTGCVSTILSSSINLAAPQVTSVPETTKSTTNYSLQYEMPSPTTTTTSGHFSQASSSESSVEGPSSTQGVAVASKEKPSADEDKIQQAADSNSPKQPFVPCKVCGDRASGFHYGVTSCEGCKGFFRRSIQKQIEYRCLRDGKCMVIRLNRNRCQYCRFKKCLAVGMSRDSVRYGRVPKRSKSQEDQSVSSSGDSTQDQSALESKQLAIYDIILSISQAHHSHCAITEDKIKNISRNPATLMTKIHISAGQVQFTNEELELQRLLMWQQLATLVTPSIHSVVEFSKRVPNFPDLSQDDQLILIKTGFFEIWLTRMSRMISKEENVILFEDGSCIPREELAVVYSPDFVTSMFEVSASFNQLCLNDTEIGLFTGIVLATADRQGLSDPQAVDNIQYRLVEALKLQVSRNHATEENLFASIIMKLPELRTLGSQHQDLLRWYRMQWHRGNLPPLFAEIYDIPKNHADSASS